jgi:dTDP-L-rhamnose 4-epimerase
MKPIPTPETKKQDINSIYSLTKKSQEDMCLMVGKAYNIPTVALRYFNVYGPRQSLSNPYTGVAAIFMSRIKNKNQPIVYEDGLQTRDFVSVHDIVQANLLAMEKNSANYETFNVGTGKPVTIISIAETLAKLYGKNIKPNITNKFRKGDVRHCFADISKIKKMLGFAPMVNFEEGMKELIEWSSNIEAIDKFDDASDELRRHGLI